MNINKQVTPHAMALIWNYQDRLGTTTGNSQNSGTLGDPQQTEPVIISTVSLKAIQTAKGKSKAAGSFTLTLAPTKNWVQVLTPGSWVAILMSQEKITEKDIYKADGNKVKMFGKITSVRLKTTTDQKTGKRQSIYTVHGVDWGYVFDTALYYDPLAKDPKDKSIGAAAVLNLDGLLDSITKNEFPTSDGMVQMVLDTWGKPSAIQAVEEQIQTIQLKPDSRFTIPDRVREYFGFDDKFVSNLLNVKFGRPVLKISNNQVNYAGVKDAVGYPNIESFIGTHSFWELLTEHCNPILNELVTDLHYDGSGFKLQLWKRIKPFLIHKDDPTISSDSYLREITSYFHEIEHYKVPLENVISCDVGTNWRDKYNFAEIRLTQQKEPALKALHAQLKADMQIFDKDAFQREGFKPMIVNSSKFLPPGLVTGGDTQDTFKFTAWKFLLKEWFFDTHRLLNGVITIVGMNEHITVGSNLLVDSRIISDSNNTNSVDKNGRTPHLLAHIESVSHNFTEKDGTREFFTTIQFVRGIIVDDANYVNNTTDKNLLDRNTRDLPPVKDVNSNTTFGTSGPLDPDPDKLNGR